MNRREFWKSSRVPLGSYRAYFDASEKMEEKVQIILRCPAGSDRNDRYIVSWVKFHPIYGTF